VKPPRFILGVNLMSLLAVATIIGFAVVVVAAGAGMTGINLDAMLIASQILCCLLAVGSIGVATHTYWRMVVVMEKKEVEGHLKAVQSLEVISWVPGTVLWIKVPQSYGSEEAEKIQEHLRGFFKHYLRMDDPPILVTNNMDFKALSVVDLLALIGRVRDEDEDDG
jgi:hypothetical protein